MIVKKFGKDFFSEGGALTLEPEEVTASGAKSGVHTLSHESGWVVTGAITEDYYVWVNGFVAYHKHFGFIAGDFEEEVFASSKEAFQDFWKHHEPQAWDYADI